MDNNNDLQQLEAQFAAGFERTRERMIAFKREKNSPIIVSRDQKVIRLDPHTLSPESK